MTRKDYVSIAAALKAGLMPGDRFNHGYALAVVAVCGALAEDNPRFDQNRFLVAIYGETNGALNIHPNQLKP